MPDSHILGVVYDGVDCTHPPGPARCSGSLLALNWPSTVFLRCCCCCCWSPLQGCLQQDDPDSWQSVEQWLRQEKEPALVLLDNAEEATLAKPAEGVMVSTGRSQTVRLYFLIKTCGPAPTADAYCVIDTVAAITP